VIWKEDIQKIGFKIEKHRLEFLGMRGMQKITPPFLIQACTSLFFIILSLFLNAVEASTDKVKVVATITPLADFARQVGGTRVEVTLLLPAGASPHTYEPTPKTVQEISKAKVFIK
jgi:ABC-type Zn uptake system ZnuABC Zn-binding protein ZnuA